MPAGVFDCLRARRERLHEWRCVFDSRSDRGRCGGNPPKRCRQRPPRDQPHERLDQPSKAGRNVASQPDSLHLDGNAAVLLAKARDRGEAPDCARSVPRGYPASGGAKLPNVANPRLPCDAISVPLIHANHTRFALGLVEARRYAQRLRQRSARHEHRLDVVANQLVRPVLWSLRSCARNKPAAAQVMLNSEDRGIDVLFPCLHGGQLRPNSESHRFTRNRPDDASQQRRVCGNPRPLPAPLVEKCPARGLDTGHIPERQDPWAAADHG